MTWWAIGPAGSTSSAGAQQAPNRRAAVRIAAAYGDAVLAGPFATEAQAASWTQAGPGAPGPGGGGPGRTRSGTRLQAVIAQAAIAAIGHCYLWGGVPGKDGAACWDCSSAVNFWVGVEAGAAIPGYPPGGYDGTVHGPSTLGWLDWLGRGVFLITRTEVTAGDIMCWQTHMGVAISNTEMVSALNPGQGTQRTGIDGLTAGETLNTLRLHAVDPSVTGIGVIDFTGTAGLENDTRAIARFVKSTVPLRQLARSIGSHGWRP